MNRLPSGSMSLCSPEGSRAVRSTVRLWIFCNDLTTHHWEKVSQLAWNAYWARRCIWSPRGCPWKRHMGTVSALRRVKTPDEREWHAQSRSKNSKEKPSQSDWFVMMMMSPQKSTLIQNTALVEKWAEWPLKPQHLNKSIRFLINNRL